VVARSLSPTYKEVAKRGALIAAVTAKRYMQPWHAAPAAAAYATSAVLRTSIALLRAWVDQGMPEGNPAKAPRAPAFARAGTRTAGLDRQLFLPLIAFQRRAPISYRDFVIPVGFLKISGIRAVEVRPTAIKAIHTSLYYADLTGSMRQQDNVTGVAGFAGFGLPPGTLR